MKNSYTLRPYLIRRVGHSWWVGRVKNADLPYSSNGAIAQFFYPQFRLLETDMSNIIEFKFPDKGAFDPLLVSDPVPDRLSKEGRLIYLRIIEKSPPGVLLQIDRLAVELAVSSTEVALKYGFYEGVGVAQILFLAI